MDYEVWVSSLLNNVHDKSYCKQDMKFPFKIYEWYVHTLWSWIVKYLPIQFYLYTYIQYAGKQIPAGCILVSRNFMDE